MQAGADRMTAELDKVEFQAADDDGLLERHGRAARGRRIDQGLLVDQIVKPVQWEQTMQTLVGATAATARFVELAPGRTLAGLAEARSTAAADRELCDDRGCA